VNDMRLSLMRLGREEQFPKLIEFLHKHTFSKENMFVDGYDLAKIPELNIAGKPLELGFDYNFERDKCLPSEAHKAKMRKYMEEAANELISGECGGECKSYWRQSCGPKEGSARTCPEGSTCQCKQSNNKAAPVVFAVSYITLFVGEIWLLPTSMAAVVPVDPLAIFITSVLGKNYHGCHCMPRTCGPVEVSGEKVCGMAFDSSLGNDDLQIGQGLTLPPAGSKCTFDAGRKKCELKGCEGHDMFPDGSDAKLGKLGRIDDETFNCWRPFSQDWEFTPKDARQGIYRTVLKLSAK